MTNPLQDIENRKGQTDMGLMAIRIYQGALVEAESHWQAFFATAAFFCALFKQNEEGGES